MQIFDELKARGLKGDRFSFHGWRDRARRRSQRNLPTSGRATLHRASHPQLHPLHPMQGVEALHERAQSHLWRGERQAGTRAIRSVLPRLGGISLRCGGMEETIHACRAIVLLRQCRTQDHVHDERDREREFQLPQGHEKRFVSQRGGGIQAAIFAGTGTLCEMEWEQDTELGARAQPTVDG